jgi:F-type H+-transporting ATPase subunit delta
MKAVRLYGQVLVDVALAPSAGVDLGSVIQELVAFSDTLFANSVAVRTFESPAVSDDEKQKTLRALCERAGLGSFSQKFLAMLNRRGRLDLLPQILKEVETLQIEKKGGVIGELVSAVPLEAGVVSGITEALTKRFQKPVHLNSKVDPAVIAGMKVTIGGVTYDGTVRSKLDKIANQA